MTAPNRDLERLLDALARGPLSWAALRAASGLDETRFLDALEEACGQGLVRLDTDNGRPIQIHRNSRASWPKSDNRTIQNPNRRERFRERS